MNKTLIDRNQKLIEKGSVVHYQNGWYRVRSIFLGSKTVNPSGIPSGKIAHKKVPVAGIYEDQDAYLNKWRQSETYQSM
jgi:hypothetical protein